MQSLATVNASIYIYLTVISCLFSDMHLYQLSKLHENLVIRFRVPTGSLNDYLLERANGYVFQSILYFQADTIFAQV